MQEPLASSQSACGVSGYWVLATGYLQAQLLYFIVVILAVEDRPFLRALDDGTALAFDFLAGGLVDPGLLHEEFFENLADFEADGVAILDEVDLVHFGYGVGDGVGEFVDFVAAQSHGGGVLTVPTLKNSLVFFHQLGLHLAEHFLVIGAGLLHFIGISFEDDAHFV